MSDYLDMENATVASLRYKGKTNDYLTHNRIYVFNRKDPVSEWIATNDKGNLFAKPAMRSPHWEFVSEPKQKKMKALSDLIPVITKGKVYTFTQKATEDGHWECINDIGVKVFRTEFNSDYWEEVTDESKLKLEQKAMRFRGRTNTRFTQHNAYLFTEISPNEWRVKDDRGRFVYRRDHDLLDWEEATDDTPKKPKELLIRRLEYTTKKFKQGSTYRCYYDENGPYETKWYCVARDGGVSWPKISSSQFWEILPKQEHIYQQPQQEPPMKETAVTTIEDAVLINGMNANDYDKSELLDMLVYIRNDRDHFKKLNKEIGESAYITNKINSLTDNIAKLKAILDAGE